MNDSAPLRSREENLAHEMIDSSFSESSALAINSLRRRKGRFTKGF